MGHKGPSSLKVEYGSDVVGTAFAANDSTDDPLASSPWNLQVITAVYLALSFAAFEMCQRKHKNYLILLMSRVTTSLTMLHKFAVDTFQSSILIIKKTQAVDRLRPWLDTSSFKLRFETCSAPDLEQHKVKLMPKSCIL